MVIQWRLFSTRNIQLKLKLIIFYCESLLESIMKSWSWIIFLRIWIDQTFNYKQRGKLCRYSLLLSLHFDYIHMLIRKLHQMVLKKRVFLNFFDSHLRPGDKLLKSKFVKFIVRIINNINSKIS